MTNEFELLKEHLKDSGCDKRQVAAGIWVCGVKVNGGVYEAPVFITAANYCVHEGDKCPRIGLPSGQGYELCQAKHAEANLAAVIIERRLKLAQDICWVAGHYYACEPCATALKEVGIREIRIREKLD